MPRYKACTGGWLVDAGSNSHRGVVLATPILQGPHSPAIRHKISIAVRNRLDPSLTGVTSSRDEGGVGDLWGVRWCELGRGAKWGHTRPWEVKPVGRELGPTW